MRDLTRAEQRTLLDLLGVVIENGLGSLDQASAAIPDAARREVHRLVNAACQVRDAVWLDLKNQEG